MKSPTGRNSLCSNESSGTRDSKSVSRSKSMLEDSCFSSRAIKNIGALDELGNFKLDPVIQSSLELEKPSYWEKIKQEFVNRSEREVMSEAKKIINEVLAEIAVNSPKNTERIRKRILEDQVSK